MVDQHRAADRLAEALTATLVPVAQRAERVEVTAATPEQVDLVIELSTLARAVTEHCRRVMMTEPVDWQGLAHRLESAARACHGQVIARSDPPAGHPAGQPAVR